jgi:hypothetical protein
MMHMVSTAMLREIVNVYGACAQCSGSASHFFLTPSPDIPRLHTARLFVLLASIRNIECAFAY